MGGKDTDADARPDVQLMSAGSDGLRHRGKHRLGQIAPIGDAARAGRHHEELVAAVATDDVVRARTARKTGRHFDEHLITDVVPEHIVDRLEAVEIDEENENLPARVLPIGKQRLQSCAHRHPICEACQRVALAQVAQPP